MSDQTEQTLRRVLAAGAPRVVTASDWGDVGRRARRPAAPHRRRVTLAAVAALAALALAGLAGAATGVISITGVTASPSTAAVVPGDDAAYAVGDRVLGLAAGPVTLARPIADESWDTAVLAADGGRLVYEAAGPSLRVHDLLSGADGELAPEGFEPVWSADGRLAYGSHVPQAGGGDVGAAFPSQIVVRASLDSPPIVWTTDPDAYEPLAWAGSRLLVAEVGPDASKTHLLTRLWAYTGPDRRTPLGTGGVIAISPDGTTAAVSDGSLDGAPSPGIRLVAVATGATIATLDLRAEAPDGIAWQAIAPTGRGDWMSGTLIAPAPAGIVSFAAASTSLSVARVSRFAGDPGLAGSELTRARFAGAAGTSAIVLGDVLPEHGNQMVPSALTCDLAAERCVRGANPTAGAKITLVEVQAP